MSSVLEHQSVLLHESIAALNLSEHSNGWFFDGTFGRGGHSRAILEQLGPEARLYATDQDPSAAEEVKKITDPRFYFSQSRFAQFEQAFPELRAESLCGALLDLGVSSPQLDDPSRGFSFLRDGELDMRMNPGQRLDAKQLVNESDYAQLSRIIARYGEERFAKQIARRIIRCREREPITHTKQLASIVSEAVPTKFHVPGKHPATRTFQAIRIAVNDEMTELQTVLPQLFRALKHGGRLVVIAFHSLEDDYVKRFVKHTQGEPLPAEIPVFDTTQLQKIRLIGRPVRASEQELDNNARARSSLMRIVEKI